MDKRQRRVIFSCAAVLAAWSHCGACGDAVALYHFDEAAGSPIAMDSAGPYYGTLFGSAEFVTDGVAGNAIGVTKAGNGYVAIGDYFRFVGSDFALVAWVRTPPGDSSPESIFVAKHRSTVMQGYLLGVNTSAGGAYGELDKAWFYQSCPPGAEPRSTTTINDGNWHQVVGVYRAGQYARIYVDGAPYEDSKTSVFIGGNDAAFAVGAIDISGTLHGYFDGWVDELQVYDHFLTDAQVQYLFEHPAMTVSGPLGDLNCDGSVDAFDIDPFVLALTDPAGYEASFPQCNRALADANYDGAVNAFDIDPFVEILTGG